MVPTNLIARAAETLHISSVRRIAEGGQKYAGKGLLGSTPIVLKVVELRPPNASEAFERARREVALLGDIDHPNVVRVLSELEEVTIADCSGVAWLEEFLDGEDLTNKLLIPWSWRDARSLGIGVAKGLGALHSRNPPVVHRDVSPANIRCLSDGSYKLMDPGFARHIGRTSLTGLYQPGTPGYLSPEHVPPARPNPASDVFAVGILLYRLLTGELPIPISAAMESYQLALRDDQAPSILLTLPDVGESRAAIVDRCLSRQSARRFLDGNELAAVLEETA